MAARVVFQRPQISRRLLSFRAPAPAPTDAQIDEINSEIAEFFGQTPPSSNPPFVDQPPTHADSMRLFEASSASSASHPQVIEATHAVFEGGLGAADKAAADATISQLRERVQFLEKLVEQLVARR